MWTRFLILVGRIQGNFKPTIIYFAVTRIDIGTVHFFFFEIFLREDTTPKFAAHNLLDYNIILIVLILHLVKCYSYSNLLIFIHVLTRGNISFHEINTCIFNCKEGKTKVRDSQQILLYTDRNIHLEQYLTRMHVTANNSM